MIDRIIDASVHHRFIVLIVVAALAVLGWQSLPGLPLDALPDPSEKQVIISTRWDRSPEVIDAQVTSPIVSTLLSVPRVASVRGISDVGGALIYVVFDDDVDLSWARSRTLEHLGGVASKLPEGVTFELAPDATSLGWVLQYVLTDRSGAHSLADLRAYQDWYVKLPLRAVRGVAEVATVGGVVRHYQVNVDPNRLIASGTTIGRVADALKRGNREATGSIVDAGGSERIVRGRGDAASSDDLAEILIDSSPDGTPLRVKDVARIAVGAQIRRGVADLDGTGEVVSGIVVIRPGENVLGVVDRVKGKLRDLEASLPAGVSIVIIYDRSDLVRRAASTFRWTIVEVMLTVAAMILIFLAHPPSAAIPLLTLPAAVLITFVAMRLGGIGANIMSFGGLAIAVGALVDASIVVVEQTHKKLEEWNRSDRSEPARAVIQRAIKEVARPSFFALLIIAVSFLPVLSFGGEEGRLFRPLAFAKSIAMMTGALLVITLDPALRVLLTRTGRLSFRPEKLRELASVFLIGRLQGEESHPITSRIIEWYEPFVRWSLRHQSLIFAAVGLLAAATVPLMWGFSTELMPPLREGVVLYMPVTMPGISVGEAQRLLQRTDRILKAFPEVEHVLGKAGRADSATDPAPLSMFETVVVLRPGAWWRRVPTWYSSWAPEWTKPVLRHITADHISEDDLVSLMNEALTMPGLANAWSMPIRGRIDMLTTGVRTPLGIKVTGTRPEEIERLAMLIVDTLRSMPSTRNAFVDPIGRGSYLDFKWNRAALARAGVTVEEAQEAIEYAVGGRNVTSVLLGRERIPVNVRYAADRLVDGPSLERTLAFGERTQRPVPIGELADIQDTAGPVMLRNDDGLLTAYVYLDIVGRDYASYIAEAARRIGTAVQFPVGYSFSWTGQYEQTLRTRRQLIDVVPLTILIVAVLLYFSMRSLPRTLFVLLAVPFSAIGAIWAIYLFGYPVSLAVWIGVIALLGIDAETGVFMLLYLDQAHDRMTRERRLNRLVDLEDAVLEGAARRVRPKLMTVLTMLVGLVPIMWSTGTGSEVMKRIAAPLLGGIFTSFALELVVYPAVYFRWRSRELGVSGGPDRPDPRDANPSSPSQPGTPHVAAVRYSV